VNQKFAVSASAKPFQFEISLGQFVHIHAPTSPSSITWPSGGDALRLGRYLQVWVVLTKHHISVVLSIYGRTAQGIRGDEHSAYTPYGV